MTLCETIHTLRRTCGRALKIVLIERRYCVKNYVGVAQCWDLGGEPQ